MKHLLILFILLSACTTTRMDFHRKALHLSRMDKQYNRALVDYYEHYRNCVGLPEELAADSAAVMLVRSMISSKDGFEVIKVH